MEGSVGFSSAQSAWAPACQDQVAGGHAGVGVVSLGGDPLALSSFVTPQFKEFFTLGWVLRTTLPTGKGGVFHLFVVYGYQGAEEDTDQLLLTYKFLQAVLVVAQVVCIGQPMLIAGDLNADPAVIPCLAEGISGFVDLALAFSRGAGAAPDVTCRFSLEGGARTRRDFLVGCPNASVASDACFVTDRWFAPQRDLAMDSCAQFLAVAEHWLIPWRAWSVCHFLRRAGHHSVWASACQVAGGHAGVGVVSLGAAQLGRALRVTLPAGNGEEGGQGTRWRRMLKSFGSLTSYCRLFSPRLGWLACAHCWDLNADPAVIPCLAKAISEGRFVDLALAFSLGEGKRPAATCKFKLDGCSGARGDFILGCPYVAAASTACMVTDRWFPPHFSLFASLGINGWSAEVSCPVVSQSLWPACWIDGSPAYLGKGL